MKEQAFANSLAAVIGAFYIICAGWVMISRDTFLALTGTWIHGVDLKALPFSQPTATDLVLGFLSAVAAAWVSGYFFVWLYNRLAK